MTNNYIVTADYHTHTVFSHGKGNIIDNVLAAKEKGLEVVGITDHGFGQPFAGLTRASFSVMEKQIEDIRKTVNGIKVLLGVEANIVNMNGDIDMTNDLFARMDIVLAGYHLSATEISSLFSMAWPGLLGHFNHCTKAQKSKNTNAYVNMIKNYKIDVVTHPGFNLDLNFEEIGKVCADYGTYIELSSRHEVPTKKALEELLKTDVRFVINSDAHNVEQIGEFKYALDLVKEYNIEERVDNFNHKELTLRSKQ